MGCSRPKAGPRPGRERGRRQLVVRHQRHQIRPVLDGRLGSGHWWWHQGPVLEAVSFSLTKHFSLESPIDGPIEVALDSLIIIVLSFGMMIVAHVVDFSTVVSGF